MSEWPCKHGLEACEPCAASYAFLSLSRISGALCDASDVVVDPPEDGVKELIAQRNALREQNARLTHLKSSVPEVTKPCATCGVPVDDVEDPTFQEPWSCYWCHVMDKAPDIEPHRTFYLKKVVNALSTMVKRVVREQKT